MFAMIIAQERSTRSRPRSVGHPGWTQTTAPVAQTSPIASRSAASNAA